MGAPTVTHGIEPRFSCLRDPFLGLGLLVWFLSALPSLLPGTPGDLAYVWADQFSDVPTLVLVMTAALLRAARAPLRRERLFWRLLAVGLAGWMTVRGLYLMIPYEGRGMGFDLATDAFYLAGYLFIALALELGLAPGGEDRVRRVESVGTLVFGFALLSYFTFAPSVFHPDAYADWVSSLFLYALFDLYLVVRLVVVYRSLPDPGWRLALPWVGITFFLWLVGDVTEGLMYRGAIGFWEPALPTDLLWLAPPLTLLVAVRVRSRCPTTRRSLTMT